MSMTLTIVLRKEVEDQTHGHELYQVVKDTIEAQYPNVKITGNLTNHLEPSED